MSVIHEPLRPHYTVDVRDPAALPHGYELLLDVLDGVVALGPEPGDVVRETVAGHRLKAVRLRAGGVRVAERGTAEGRT